MITKLNKDEKYLVGTWLKKNGVVIKDSVCERIEWLIDTFFDEVAVGADNWSVLYKNPEDGSYWELTFPQSHMHGGGPPALERISIDVATKRYSLTS